MKNDENTSNKTDPSYEDLSETESISQDDENRMKNDLSLLSKSEAWENNSDTPDITIEINDSTTTMEESSMTEAEDDDNKANLTIQEFLEETETIANDIMEDADDMFSTLITKATGQTWENVDLGDSNIPPPLLLQENLRF